MEQQLIQDIVEEVQHKLTGRFFGKIFQLSSLSLAIDFGLRHEFLFISVDPSKPRFYLFQRSVKELEKQSDSLSHFGQILRARLGGSTVGAITKDLSDRVVRLKFLVQDELGNASDRSLIVQLTGKASNLLLLDHDGRVTDAFRTPRGAGQTIGEGFLPPPTKQNEPTVKEIPRSSSSPSEDADAYFRELDRVNSFLNRANSIHADLKREIRRRQKLKHNLQQDLTDHGDPEKHKRLGDLLLANVATAKRHGSEVELTDYYSDGAPLITIDIDESSSLQDEAARQFRLYTKARRAQEEIAERLVEIERELELLKHKSEKIEQIIAARDENALEHFDRSRPVETKKQTRAEQQKKIPGVRQYLSSDGFEIWVGRAARDNDNLTFRLARPNDLWLHAGDYPGSHVIVRNPSRKDIPHRTIIEAAQLAGHFSQANTDTKVVVHYAERKFLSKPKGAAPGLVRMSRFRSITVEPKESVARI
ncbi:MAG: hypothetical protein C5B55_03255 [Blastocatellia bacterium]|nr:MAG: hypothetical protein C5B55_03255 [Blastocatellia bacterium]